MKNLILVLSIFFSHSTFAQTSLGGKITDEETGEALLFANLAVYKNGNLVTGTQTDFDGFYNIANIDPGTYDVEASYSGYQSVRTIKVIVFGGQANNVDFTLPHSAENDESKIVEFEPSVLNTTPSSGCVTSDQLNKLPPRNLGKIISGQYHLPSYDEIYMGGGRGTTFYMVDGIRCCNQLIPEQEIEDKLELTLGGTPAFEN